MLPCPPPDAKRAYLVDPKQDYRGYSGTEIEIFVAIDFIT